MGIRSRRRVETARTLEDMTDDELLQVYFCRNIVADPYTVLAWFTEADQTRAGEILTARGVFD